MSDTDPAAEHQGGEGFIQRWSRRKHADRKRADDEVDLQASTAGLSSEEIDEDLPCDDDMPSIDSLDEDSDYSAFMSPKVSEALRTLALRKLFHGQSFNIRDGLDDYDDDFTSFTKLGDVVTAEMRRQVRRLQAAMSDEACDDIDDEVMIADARAEMTGETEAHEPPAQVNATRTAQPALEGSNDDE